MASYIVTGIHAAARAGKLQKVQDYIAKGGDVNKPDREHCSPLMWACWGGHVEIVKRLLEEGAKPDTFSHQHASAMHWATWGGHTEIVKLLLEYKVSLDESDEQDGTPLHYAAKKGFVGLAKVIVSAGGTVDVRNVKDMTPLHLACHYNKVEVAKFLIIKQAAVGSVDHINRTPLHYACLKSHINSVRLLLEWGAEVMVIDNKGKLPLHLVGQSASQKNRGKSEDIIKLLKSKMPEDDLDGLDGSYHPESDGTLMGAAASVAKNVANHTAPNTAEAAPAPTASTSMASAEGSSLDGENGVHPALDSSYTNGDRIIGPDETSVHADDAGYDHTNGGINGRPEEHGALRRATPKTDGSGRKSMVTLNLGTGGTLNSKGVSPARTMDGTATLPSAFQGSPDVSFAEKQRRKKSTINIMMSDGVVSIGEGKSGSEASPTHKRRGSNFGLGVTSAAPAPGTRAKRSPQGSVTGGSSTKGSERDEMEEVSNEEVAYDMALEQIIADLDDLEERVENLNVDQKTNEDILLNVLKRVDETEKDLRKMKRSTIAKDFEAKQTNPGKDVIAEQPTAPTLSGAVSGHGPDGWPGSGNANGGPFASLGEVGVLRQAVASKDKELREIRNQMQDRDADLDTLRKAGRNLRERLEEKDVETRDILDRLARMEELAGKDVSGAGGCVCSLM